MASTNKTENFDLNQWVGTDPVLMEDFNADNAKIDAALAQLKSGQLRVATGSYVGKELYGESSPNVLNFDFKPLFMAVKMNHNTPINPSAVAAYFVYGVTTCDTVTFNNSGSVSEKPLTVVWGDNSITWWYGGNADNAYYGSNLQLNSSGVSYYYVAFGI